jgi:hypothetical protein
MDTDKYCYSVRAPVAGLSSSHQSTRRGLARRLVGPPDEVEVATARRQCLSSTISSPVYRLAGVIPGQSVSVIAVQPHGAVAAELTYKTAEAKLASGYWDATRKRL